MCIQLTFGIILYDFPNVEEKKSMQLKQIALKFISKYSFIASLLPWRVFISLQEYLHPKKTY